MHKFLIQVSIMACLFIISTPIFADDDSTSNENNIAMTIHDDYQQFGINDPIGWKPGGQFPNNIYTNEKTGSMVSVRLYDYKEAGGTYESIDDIISEYKDGINSSQGEILDEGPVSVKGSDGENKYTLDGKYLIYTATNDDNVKVKIWAIFVQNKNKVFYVWRYAATTENYENDYPTAKSMLASWNLYNYCASPPCVGDKTTQNDDSNESSESTE